MKKRNLLFMSIGAMSLLFTPLASQNHVEITKETFGTVGFDVNADGPHTNTQGHKYYKWNEITFGVSTNGHIEGGALNSIRTNTYLAATEKQGYLNASKEQAVCLHPATQYSESIFSEVSFVGIDITNYTDLLLGFGFAKRANWGSEVDQRGVSITYRIDGGSWVEISTDPIPNPLELDTWAWVELPIAGLGATLDIKFVSTGNQLMLDDITVSGVADGGVSLVENDINEKVSVHPNPMTDVLNINTGTNLVVNYEITSISGVVMLKGVVVGGAKAVDVSSLNSGVYFVSLINNGAGNAIKVVKK
jgi:hypothetical protein